MTDKTVDKTTNEAAGEAADETTQPYEPDPTSSWGECFDDVAIRFFNMRGISVNGYRIKLGVKLKDLNGSYGDTERKQFVGFVNKQMRDYGYFGETGKITKADATKKTKLGAVRRAVEDQVLSEKQNGDDVDNREKEIPPHIAP